MRLLLVEDEQAFAAELTRGLVREGFSVDQARTGPDGLWKAHSEEYDALLLDILLPGCSGYEIVRRLRAAGVWTPIVMLTAKDGEHDIADALDLGADDYLVKPFSYVVLLARLRALVRRGSRERPAELTVGDLRVDPAGRRCWRGDVEIQLTTREFALLLHLAQRSGQVCSKSQLLENVWDQHFDGDLNVVEVYVGYLRRKIDQPFGRTSIETVRGAGYRLRAET
jgi:DNA-binding response OmpR family regulator